MYINQNIKKFDRDGFFILRSLFSKKNIEKFELEINKISKILIKKYKRPYINLTKDNKLNTAHNLNKIFPRSTLMKIPKNLYISEIIKKIFNENFIIRNLEIFAKPAKTGMKAPFHQDNFYWNIEDKRAVNIWIAIDKVNKKNGGLIYLKGSHKQGILNHTVSKAKGTSQEIKDIIIKKLKYKKTIPELNPGDCLIHHCEAIHGSESNLTNKSRRAIVISLRARSSKINKKKLNIYLSRLKKIINT